MSAAQKKKAEALYNRAGVLYARNRFEDALVEYRAAAALGHATAMFNIGMAHDIGLGAAKNVAEAHEWYKKAAAAGSLDGMINLANDLSTGRPEIGVAADRAEAMRLMRAAAQGGHTDGMFNLGFWLGEADEADPEQVVWFRRAAETGSKEAMTRLGMCYADSKGGLKRDVATANSWYLKAAALGSAHAMHNLGINFEGDGTESEKSLAAAAEWYARASKAGLDEAPAALERVNKKLAALRSCGVCGKPADNHCSGCIVQKYCSSDCQRAHWKEHKAECKIKQALLKAQKK